MLNPNQEKMFNKKSKYRKEEVLVLPSNGSHWRQEETGQNFNRLPEVKKKIGTEGSEEVQEGVKIVGLENDK